MSGLLLDHFMGDIVDAARVYELNRVQCARTTVALVSTSVLNISDLEVRREPEYRSSQCIHN